MSSVGENTTNINVNDSGENAAPNPDAAANDAAARQHGWSAPVSYNYGMYNAPMTAPRVEGDGAAMDGNAEAANLPTTEDVPAWGANSARYEWKEEYGDVGPAFKLLEDQLFGTIRPEKAEYFNELVKEMNVTLESETKIKPVTKFEDAGLHPVMLDNVRKCGYEIPTPVQAYCLPAVFTNNDIIAVAQTGSGKTAAFLIPTISKLMGKAKKLAAPRPAVGPNFDDRIDGVRAEPLILVVCPTRELAVQIFDEARRLCYRSMLRPCVAYGGASSREQKIELRKGCDILIGTPGRLKDYIGQPSLLSLARVKYTIIDEADEMVAADWSEDLKMIFSGGDNNEDADHIFMMFSATFPKEARQLAREHLKNNYIRIHITRAGSTVKRIHQEIIYVDDSLKRQALYDLLMSKPVARTIVFVNTKKTADLLDDYLFNKSLPTTSIHADRNQREREDSLRSFKSGRTPILVATGVSARGLDVKNVLHIINFDLPSLTHGGINEYVHRIGRTGRIGNEGLSTSFYNDRNEDLGPLICMLLIESGQKVPDFLEQYKPEDGEAIDWDDKSEPDEDEAEKTDGEATGGYDNDVQDTNDAQETNGGHDTNDAHDANGFDGSDGFDKGPITNAFGAGFHQETTTKDSGAGLNKGSTTKTSGAGFDKPMITGDFGAEQKATSFHEPSPKAGTFATRREPAPKVDLSSACHRGEPEVAEDGGAAGNW